MGQALYRTYRSKKLSELVGQEHITTALARALQKGTFAHAYLFTGPRGTGKTSIARILAHEINNLSYTDDSMHLDIIEIDAASNRRIDEIRDLRDKVHLAPTSAKYKVYIIDEVHMLTKEAFNALLKTLEEPPEHVIFILATTEAHKLPETIISRTQRFAFKPVDLELVAKHLRSIAKKEGIKISDDALALVAAHGEGSFRDSIGLLDQVRNTANAVELTDVQGVLGIAPAELIAALLRALTTHDLATTAGNLVALYEQGFEAAQLAKQLSDVLRQQLISGACILPPAQTIHILEKLLQVPASPEPRTALQIVLLDAALDGASPVAAVAPAPKVAPAVAVPAPAVQIVPTHPAKKEVTPEPKTSVKTNIKTEPVAAPTTASSENVLSDEAWQLVLGALKQKYSTLHSVVRMAHPSFEPGKVTLAFRHAFHQRRCSEAQTKQNIIDVIAQTIGEPIHLECIVDEAIPAPLPAPPTLPKGEEIVHAVSAPAVSAPSPATPAPTAPAPTELPSDIATISNIFGGAEILES
jgi:DNA polymerase-3 subunit gamma/tau